MIQGIYSIVNTSGTPFILSLITYQAITSLSRNTCCLVYTAIKFRMRVIFQPFINCLNCSITQLSILLVTHIVRNTFNLRSRFAEISLLFNSIFRSFRRKNIFRLFHTTYVLFNNWQSFHILHSITMLVTVLQFLKLSSHHHV